MILLSVQIQCILYHLLAGWIYGLCFSFLQTLTRGYDVTPNATVFARSSIHSVLEDLALFSCMISNADDPDAFAKMVSAPFSFSQLQQHCAPLYCEMAHQSRLFQPLQDEQMVIPSALRHDCERIIEEYCYGSPPLVSPTVLCYYLKTIYPSSKEHWKNMDREIVPYVYLDEILTLLPRRGIPNNRDESKQLQSFYKDTLFHEFDHQCPICGIDLPHMLIASHIKPFRDCAHYMNRSTITTDCCCAAIMTICLTRAISVSMMTAFCSSQKSSKRPVLIGRCIIFRSISNWMNDC